jgi:hypothetical protein
VLATALVTIIAPADAIRLRYPSFEKLYEKVVGFLMRESERVSTQFLPLRFFFDISAEIYKRSHLVYLGRFVCSNMLSA